MDTPDQPTFLTNDIHRKLSVAKTLGGYLDNQIRLNLEPRMDIASAYFNPDGFASLQKQLTQMTNVRLLLGAEPSNAPAIVPLAGRPSGRRQRSQQELAAMQQHAEAIRMESNLTGFTPETYKSAQDLVAWLGSTDEFGQPRVKVRRLTKEFLHGKAFIVESAANRVVFAGSSNFTYAGLNSNRELNIGQYNPHAIYEVQAWFDQLWEEAEDFDLAAVYEARWQPYEPSTIFGRMLWERYRGELDKEQHAASSLGLTRFQKDGVWRARRILHELNGVIIADEVGLGKTFVAGELISDAIVKRRQKVLVIAPATLRDSTWKPFLRQYNLQSDVISYQDLVASINNAGSTGSSLQALDDYAMVVIDEAHALRNPNSQRAEAVRRLLEGAAPKDVVMLTATPVNNSLQDVYTLISYFVTNDAQFSNVGVPSLQRYFKDAEELHPDELSPEHLFDVLDQVAVRRTRKFVRNHYANDTVVVGGKSQRISFPEPKVKRVDYDIESDKPGFFRNVATALGARHTDEDDQGGLIEAAPGTVLTMARYVPERFRLERAEARGGKHATSGDEAFQQQNAGLLRSNLLKRFESSLHAYQCTLDALIASHESFLQVLRENGLVVTGRALREWNASDSDDFEAFLLKNSGKDYVKEAESAGEYDVDKLCRYVKADLRLLGELRAEVERLRESPDVKVEALVEELAAIAQEADEEGHSEEERRNKRKVLVFTYFSDTAEYLTQKLGQCIATDERLAVYRGRLLTVTGQDTGDRAARIANFAPVTAGTGGDADLYDLVIATDVLSEGVNLQQARHIINYDLPWNPMRLVQRHGRIDRIGSEHPTVYMRCFFPDKHLDEMLGLEERIQNKLKLANASFGTGKGILPDAPGRDGTFTETRTRIDELRRGETGLFASGGGAAALSGEDYRRTLEKMLEDPQAADLITNLPWGSGSAYVREGHTAGIVYCVRIADHDVPWFRYLPLNPNTLKAELLSDDEESAPGIVDDTLSALAQADPLGSPRFISQKGPENPELVDAALTHWESVQKDVKKKWNEQRLLVNSGPDIPRVLRVAGDHVRKYGGELGEEQDTITSALEQPHSYRIQKQVREVLAKEITDGEKSQQLAAVVKRNNLKVPPRRPNQSEIKTEDVRLICWMAFVPRPVGRGTGE